MWHYSFEMGVFGEDVFPSWEYNGSIFLPSKHLSLSRNAIPNSTLDKLFLEDLGCFNKSKGKLFAVIG